MTLDKYVKEVFFRPNQSVLFDKGYIGHDGSRVVVYSQIDVSPHYVKHFLTKLEERFPVGICFEDGRQGVIKDLEGVVTDDGFVARFSCPSGFGMFVDFSSVPTRASFGELRQLMFPYGWESVMLGNIPDLQTELGCMIPPSKQNCSENVAGTVVARFRSNRNYDVVLRAACNLVIEFTSHHSRTNFPLDALMYVRACAEFANNLEKSDSDVSLSLV